MSTSSQDTFAFFYNNAVTTSKFPSFLKMANITTILKKGSKIKKENFKPFSISPVLPKFSKN